MRNVNVFVQVILVLEIVDCEIPTARLKIVLFIITIRSIDNNGIPASISRIPVYQISTGIKTLKTLDNSASHKLIARVSYILIAII